MSPDRARRIEELYAEALKYKPEERLAFLARTCGDDESLRREVESLIEEETGANSFMERPAIEAVARDLAARHESSWTGRRLGHYQLGPLLGAGGMGKVYQATDTRLGRTVAIKILAEDSLDSSEAKLRFDREARAIAALNHPHICVLHDIGEEDGIDFLVLEFLKGITLAQRLAKGTLPPSEVFKIALQITDALDKAHRQGVTHRDLKPANVLLTDNGAKLLDFGLAKLHEAGADAALPTDSQRLTGPGVIMGTPQYMAPEQIEGKPVDSRTDVFAFGCVWFEMLTGKKAFTGETSASLMAAILRGDPPELPTDFSPALRHALGQCLAKNPEARWQSMADLRHEILWIAEAAAEPVPTPRRVSRREILAWGAVGVLGTAATVAWFRQREAPGVVETRARFSIPDPPGLEMNPFSTAPALSPDGQMLVFHASDGSRRGILWLRQMDSGEIRMLPETDGALSAFWSFDNRYVAFFANDKLKRVPVSGGPAEIICDSPGGSLGGCWNESGVIVFQQGGTGVLHQVQATGGPSAPLMSQHSGKSPAQHRPCFLPDGKTVLFTQVSRDPGESGVYAITLGSSEARRILPSVGVVRYVAPGYLLFGRDGKLTAQPFDASNLKTYGDPWVVATDVWSFQEVSRFDVSANGILVYSRVVPPTSQLTWFDRLGRPQGSVGPAGPFIHLDLSRDEKRVVVERYEGTRGVLWVLDVAGGAPTRLTFGESWALQAYWAPDNVHIVYVEARDYALKISRLDARSSRSDDLVKDMPMSATSPSQWSDDGRYVVVGGEGSLGLLTVGGEPKVKPYVPTPSPAFGGRLSPDGKWMAYLSTESGAPEVYVAAFPDPTVKRRLSTAGGLHPRWRADGKELFYLAPDKSLMAVSMPSPDRAAAPVPLFKTATVSYFYGSRNDYAPSRDGERFLVNTQTVPGSQFIEVVIGWKKAVL